jgi:uncharacterized membrane protein YuzA (DUF378 family)
MTVPIAHFMGCAKESAKKKAICGIGDLLATITCLVVGILGVCGTIPMGHAAGGVLIGVSGLIVILYIVAICRICADDKKKKVGESNQIRSHLYSRPPGDTS